MVYDFLITLKKSDYRAADQVSQFMYFLALVVFGYYYYNYQKSGTIYLYFGTALIIWWIYTFIQKRKNGQAFFRFGLLIAAVGWFTGPEKNILMGLLYTVAALLEKQIKFPQEIGFTQDEISFNTFPRKVFNWNEINNALIKDGLLTIDRKNNKLFQSEIEGDVSADIEKEFNDFCSRCINAESKNTETQRI